MHDYLVSHDKARRARVMGTRTKKDAASSVKYIHGKNTTCLNHFNINKIEFLFSSPTGKGSETLIFLSIDLLEEK